MNFKVIDNFLPKEEHHIIKEHMMSSEFPWYYSKFINNLDEKQEKNNFIFFHGFYSNYCPRSEKISLLDKLIYTISPRSLSRIKANLTTKTEKIIKFGLHKDNHYNCTTAIYYVNTCNGYTLFEDGTKIESVENRFLCFDSNILHLGTTCTDENVRIIINFNYF